MNELSVSRFFINSDPKISELIVRMPEAWWSRFYEYQWALNFVSQEDVILDAACGISHPFKFYLSDLCASLHACDLDPRIESKQEILDDIVKDFGNEEAAKIDSSYFDRMDLKRCDLTKLPYAQESFDTIFCISVLEHLPKEAIKLTLQEFKRTLKKDGKLVLTFDYPTIDLHFLAEKLEEVGLAFVSEVDFELPENAIKSTMWGELYCFRALLKNLSS